MRSKQDQEFLYQIYFFFNLLFNVQDILIRITSTSAYYSIKTQVYTIIRYKIYNLSTYI